MKFKLIVLWLVLIANLKGYSNEDSWQPARESLNQYINESKDIVLAAEYKIIEKKKTKNELFTTYSYCRVVKVLKGKELKVNDLICVVRQYGEIDQKSTSKRSDSSLTYVFSDTLEKKENVIFVDQPLYVMFYENNLWREFFEKHFIVNGKARTK